MTLRPADLRRIDNLHPDVRVLCLEHYSRCVEAGIEFWVPQAYRSKAEQAAIWEQGRNDAGQIVRPDLIVTKSPPGWSWHEYGLAYDIVIALPDLGTVTWDLAVDSDHDRIPDYLEAARIGRELGMEAGFFWRHPDPPHFEHHPNLSIHEAVQKFGMLRRVPDNYFWRPKGEVKA